MKIINVEINQVKLETLLDGNKVLFVDRNTDTVFTIAVDCTQVVKNESGYLVQKPIEEVSEDDTDVAQLG